MQTSRLSLVEVLVPCAGGACTFFLLLVDLLQL